MSISVRNNTNASFYRRHGRRSSLLIHPNGIKLLEYYVGQKQKPLEEEDTELADTLAQSLEPVVFQPEPTISTALRDALKEYWQQNRKEHLSVTGEKEETVSGELSQSITSGDPDAVVRMHRVGVSGEVDQQKRVMLIVEVSVDKNGGEKKVGQAFDYASLIDGPNETVILFSLHVDGLKKLKVLQEAFIYKHNEEESKRKLGFLWREAFEKTERESTLNFLKTSFEGVVRCLKCAEYLRTIPTTTNGAWMAVSDNVAIENKEHVFKIFDNRFHPTSRRPDMWLQNDLPWIADLKVKKCLEFKESSSIDDLGKPNKKRRHGEDSPSMVPYPRGSVLIIKYKFVNGTHFASRISHFQDIARSISAMHEAGIIHGDIRGFNMLHPHPQDIEGGISKSCLIDFDLCGSEDDVYPPGYADRVADNYLRRCGRPCETMKKWHDWREFVSAMGIYSVSDTNAETMDAYRQQNQAWQELTLLSNSCQKDGGGSVDLVAAIDAFISKHGDVMLTILPSKLHELKEMVKGTGKPQ